MNHVYYIMGVSGCGKSTVGLFLARKLGIPFLDGDDFHPPENVQKMASGQPLNDKDRIPWLENIAASAKNHLQQKGLVMACSALKASYRRILEGDFAAQVRWIYLKGSFELIMARMQARTGHFMPPDLLKSQFDTLEEPESAWVLDIEDKPEVLVQNIFDLI